MIFLLAAAALALAPAPAGPQDTAVEPELGALLAPDPLGPGPWDDDVLLLRSEDGKTFLPHGILAVRAAAPAMVRAADGRLTAVLMGYPDDRPEGFDQVAVTFGDALGDGWSEPLPVVFSGLPEGQTRPYDPCLVALPDGRLRLYFTSHPEASPESGPFAPGQYPATWSAVSDDGVLWIVEPGVRFGVEGSRVVDPAVALFADHWHYVAPIEGRDGVAYHAVSTDGLTFRRLPDVELLGAGPWRGSLLADGERLRFFGSGRIGWSASTSDGLRWRFDPRTVWSGAADPSVVRLDDGSLLLAGAAPGLREQQDEALDPEAALGAALGGAGGIAANDRYVYVLRGDLLYMFEAQTLKFVKATRLPTPKEPGGLGGPGASRRR